MPQFITVARLSELPPGEMKTVEFEGEPVVLANVDGEVFAFNGECTHQGGPLGEGLLVGDSVECPWHGGQFNVKTGEVIGPPPATDVSSYDVAVEGDEVKMARLASS